MNELYIVVYRNFNGEIFIHKEKTLLDAVCQKKGYLEQLPFAVESNQLSKMEIDIAIDNFKKYGRDHYCNGRDDVSIFHIP